MELHIIGGGLAGTEAAWQAAERGLTVVLHEMRPHQTTGAHQTDQLAELICSNSLGSNLPNRASGMLKAELRKMKSLLIACADASSLPAGNALAVDRQKFSACVQRRLEEHPRIRVVREEVRSIPEKPAIIATGPLTSADFSEALADFTGRDHLFFFDAIAPIVHRDSIDMEIAFRADRYGPPGENVGDYINCPLNEHEYHRFREALLSANRIPLKVFEEALEKGVDAGGVRFFQGCQPIEIIAARGEKALAFGPMRPTGLTNPKTGRWPFAVVQLRQDTLAGDHYNLVGFQTNLTYSEQSRVFRLIPGLEKAEFVRFGHMHRNTFIASPTLLDARLAFRKRGTLFLAGQLAGIEGYAGNIASGLIAGINAAHALLGRQPFILPVTTMTGALIHYITHAELKDFQPTKAMFGLLPKPDDGKRRSKGHRYTYYMNRGLADLDAYLSDQV